MEILVRSQSYAERCEVCHKSDCFNPRKNYCSRCAGLADMVRHPRSGSCLQIIPLCLAVVVYGVAFGMYITGNSILGFVYDARQEFAWLATFLLFLGVAMSGDHKRKLF